MNMRTRNTQIHTSVLEEFDGCRSQNKRDTGEVLKDDYNLAQIPTLGMMGKDLWKVMSGKMDTNYELD